MRVLAGIILFLSVYIAPWWLTLILALVLLFLFNYYIEAVIAAIFIDVLYNNFSPLTLAAWKWSIIFLIIFIFIKPLKSRLKFYSLDN